MLFDMHVVISHLDTAKWLYSISKTDNNTKININAMDNNAFMLHV